MKRNSWHYECAKLANDNTTILTGDMSICEYTRKVVYGLFLFAMVCAMLVAFVVMICVGAYQLVGAAFGFAVIGAAAYITLIILTLDLCIHAHAAIKCYTQKKSASLMQKDNSTFIAKAYRSYKEKVCFAVEFEEDK